MMTDSNPSTRSTPSRSTVTISPSSSHVPLSQSLERGARTDAAYPNHPPLFTTGNKSPTDSSNPTSRSATSYSEAFLQPQRFSSPGRSRGKSFSLSTNADNVRSPAKSLSPPGVIGQDPSPGVSLKIHRSETPSPAPSSYPLVPHSPVSPHKAKPRGGLSDELSSQLSETNFTYCASEGGFNHRMCAVPARADRGLRCHPEPGDESETGDFLMDADSFKSESDNGVVDTESAAGSNLTETGSPAPSDSISDCSNSDVEIYLETHGLDDSAMRMNCVGVTSLLEQSPLRKAGAESPVLPTFTSRTTNEANSRETHNPTNLVKLERDEPEGWVTNSANAFVNQEIQSRANPAKQKSVAPPAVQRGESFRLSMEDQEDGNYGASSRASVRTGNKSYEQTASSRLPPDPQAGRPSRVRSELNPTSVDFKPRMAIELKPPLAEFKPAGFGFGFGPNYSTFTSDQLPSERVLGSAARTLSQHEVDLQSNRAIPSHNFPSRGTNCPGDIIYPEQPKPSIIHEDTSNTGLEERVQEPGEQSSGDDSNKSPNVYINGLPPHFPEDQLHALAEPFGEVKSVRTFTRHVRDSESGYGFVLFETIEAAERCIVALRKYRNLHPTFSKQIHKIPGTIYAQAFARTASESMNSFGSWDSKRDETDTFKTRMENLHDPTSTNLYMEGLPLSIDEPTLAALVSPHRISSSRFFQTRLSHPPRIIAFVRLETRAGAEDIIERLHGRMVRGWNDTGSRISVRFADTAEQRELRRAEKAVKEGDNTASRLTIAQAALLNLRGQELRQAAKINTLPVIGERRRNSTPEYPYSESSSSSIQLPAPQTSRHVFEVDYSLAPRGNHPVQRAQSPPRLIHAGHGQPYGRPAPRSVDPSMAILLDNLRNGNNSNAGFRGTNVTHYDSYGHQALQQNSHYPSDDYSLRPPPAHAKSGYTATEEFIMRAHAESRRPSFELGYHIKNRRDHDSEVASANISTGVRGYRTRAAAITLDRKGQSSALAEIEPVSVMNEDEFHAAAIRGHQDQPQVSVKSSGEQDPDVTIRGLSREYSSRNGQGVRQVSRNFHTPVLPPQAQFTPTIVAGQHHNQHVRSTTFPHRPTPNPHPRHQQHNSMSMPSTSQRTPQHAATAVMSQNTLVHDKNDHQDALENQTFRREINKVHSKLQHASPTTTTLHRETYDLDNQPSPSLISPTLTYSSQTPSTLSPATPFFGSFNSQNEGFDRNSGLDGKKIRAAGH